MKSHWIIKDIQLLAMILFVVTLLSLCFGGYEAIARMTEPKGRVSCSSFSTYKEALRAYSAGATWLDHDSDGIPCEVLYKHDNPGNHGE